jgi:hypothetical protein
VADIYCAHTTSFIIATQIADPVASFTADRDYDQERVSQAVVERHPVRSFELPRHGLSSSRL